MRLIAVALAVGCHTTPREAVLSSVAPPPASTPKPIESSGSCGPVPTTGTRWVARMLTTGKRYPGPHTLRTFTLALSGSLATLVIHEQSARGLPAHPDDPSWACTRSIALHGKAVTHG